MAQTTRGYSAGSIMLMIEGQPAGLLRAAEGGDLYANVIADPPDQDGVVRKRQGAVGIEPIRITFGAGMDPALYRWMAEFAGGRCPTRSGAVVFADVQLAETARIEFVDALIARLAVPALDAGSREAAYFELTFQPARATYSQAGRGGRLSVAVGKKKSKQWLGSNFRLEIGDLPSGNVRRVEPFALEQGVAPSEADQNKLVVTTPLRVPDLAFTLAEAESAELRRWFVDTVVRMNWANAARTATLEALDPTLREVLFRFTSPEVRICRLSHERQEDGAEVVASVRAQLFCDRLDFAAPEDAPPADPPAVPPPAAPPAPAAGKTPTEAALADAVVAVLRERLVALRKEGFPGDGVTDPAWIAQRLKSTARSGTADAAATPTRREQGLEFGTRWAATAATREELKAIAALESREWSSIRLDERHSLAWALDEAGALPAGIEGGVDLGRDRFAEGLVVGAAQVWRQVQPLLA